MQKFIEDTSDVLLSAQKATAFLGVVYLYGASLCALNGGDKCLTYGNPGIQTVFSMFLAIKTVSFLSSNKAREYANTAKTKVNRFLGRGTAPEKKNDDLETSPELSPVIARPLPLPSSPR